MSWFDVPLAFLPLLGETFAFAKASATPYPVERGEGWAFDGRWSVTFRIVIDRVKLSHGQRADDENRKNALENFERFHRRSHTPEEATEILERYDATMRRRGTPSIDQIYTHEREHVTAGSAVIAFDAHVGQLRKLLDEGAAARFADERTAQSEANIWATRIMMRLRQLWKIGAGHEAYAAAAALGGAAAALLPGHGTGIDPPSGLGKFGELLHAPPPTGDEEAWVTELLALTAQGYLSIDPPP